MGIFSIFKKGLKKTRDEGITAQLDEVMDSYEKITPEFFDDLDGKSSKRVADLILKNLRSTRLCSE
jgi:DNA-binding protein Fis